MKYLVIFMILLLAACGGGGGSNAGSGSNTYIYTGEVAQATLKSNDNSASIFSDHVLRLKTLLSQDLNVVDLAAFPRMSLPSAPSATVMQVSSGSVKNKSINGLNKVTSEVSQQPVYCESGSGFVKLDGDPLTKIGSATTTFNNCSQFGVVYAGTIRIDGLSPYFGRYTKLKITYHLQSTTPSEYSTIAGTLDQDSTDVGVVTRTVANLVAYDSVSNSSLKIDNLVYENGNVSGRIYDAKFGYVDVAAATFPYVQLFTGANNSHVLMQKMEVPNNLEDEPDFAAGYEPLWQFTLYDGTSQEPVAYRTRPDGSGYIEYMFPTTSIPETPKVRLEKSPVALVGVAKVLDATMIGDANADWLTYSWSLIQKPASSQLVFQQLGHQPTQSFIPDAVGTYVFKLSISDGTFVLDRTLSVRTSFSRQLNFLYPSKVVFDELHHRLFGLLNATNSSFDSLWLLDMKTGNDSKLALNVDVNGGVVDLDVSSNNKYMAIIYSTRFVVLFDLDTMVEIGRYDYGLNTYNCGAYFNGSVRVDNSGKIFVGLSCDFGSKLFRLIVPGDFTEIMWRDSTILPEGSSINLLDLDDAHQRLITVQRRPFGGSSLKSFDTQTLAPLATSIEVPEAASLYMWYLPNTGTVLNNYGQIFDVDTMTMRALPLSGVNSLRVVAPYGPSGVLAVDSYGDNPDQLIHVFNTLGEAGQPWSFGKPYRFFMSSDFSMQYWVSDDERYEYMVSP